MTDPSVQLTLALLEGVERRNDSEWWALCPCHDDHNPSLKISVSESGKTLLKCFAGCSQDALVDRLFRNNGTATATATPGFTPMPPKPAKPAKTFASPKNAIRSLQAKLGEPSNVWSYHGADGGLDLVVARWDYPDGRKEFRPITRVSEFGREWKIGGSDRPTPLYNLDSVFKATTVYVCEGEKAADAASTIGLTATTSAGGSNAWKKTDWNPLAGKRVRILPDNDAPGRKCAKEVADHLATLDPRPDVQIAELPGIPEGGDIVEWLDLQGDAVEPEVLVDRIEGMFAERLQTRPFGYMTSAELDGGDFALESLIDDILVGCQPGVIAGPGKTLKTGLSIDLTISLATGGWFLQKFKANKPVKTGLISGESGRGTIQETARRIAHAKGVDLRDVTNAVWAFDLPQLGHGGSEAELERFIRDHEIKVLIVDPTYLALAIGDDAGNLFRMGSLLKGLSKIAQEAKCTPLLVHHFRKAQITGETPELTAMAWAGLAEWSRQWLLLNRRTAYDPDNGGSHKLWLVSGGSAGHSGQWGIDIEEGTQKTPGGRFWDVKVMLPSEAKASCVTANDEAKESRQEAARERKLNRDLQTILKLLEKFPDGETVSKVGGTAGMDSKRYWPAVNLGREQGSIVDCQITKGRAKYDAIKLCGKGGPDDSDDSDSVRLSGSSGVCPMNSLPVRESSIGPSDPNELFTDLGD